MLVFFLKIVLAIKDSERVSASEPASEPKWRALKREFFSNRENKPASPAALRTVCSGGGRLWSALECADHRAPCPCPHDPLRRVAAAKWLDKVDLLMWRLPEDAPASRPTTTLGRASATRCLNEVQVGHHGQPSHGCGQRQRGPEAGEAEEGANRRRAAKRVLGVQSHTMADGWKALVDLPMTRSYQ